MSFFRAFFLSRLVLHVSSSSSKISSPTRRRAVGLSVHLVDCFCFPSSSSSNCLLTNMPPALVSYSCLSCLCQWCLCFLCFLLTLVGVCNDLTGTKSWRQSTRKSCERRRERGLGRSDLSPSVRIRAGGFLLTPMWGWRRNVYSKQSQRGGKVNATARRCASRTRGCLQTIQGSSD